ncbi:glycosyltransferase family 9 protein [Geomonas agri]|uniref:glycosyltransferase family 9 protein n=1 Tax=Geomonas agri TaxID=2873702 RepID=UPI001CD4630F|nr:glycosyltransferase family 9 protein [Geomonas agri]
MQAKHLKRLDSLAGPLLARLLPRRKKPATAVAPGSALIIRPGGIGDAVLLIPMLRALQDAYPLYRIDILAERRNSAAFEFSPGLHAVHCYDEPGELRAVLKNRYDLVIDTEQWYRLSALVSRLIRCRRSIGFATNERKRLFTDAVPYDLGEYEAFSFFRLLAPLGIPAPGQIAVPFLDIPAAAQERAGALLARLGEQPFVAIFPGASVQRKEWGGVRFRQVAASVALAGHATVVVGGKEDDDVADAIARATGAINLAGRTSLAETAAVIAAAKVLLTGDSGLLHIAAGLGTRTLSLFGPSDAVKWAPKGEGHRAFASSLPCAPCAKWGTIPPCAHEGSCIDADPAEVARALIQMLREE